LYMSFSPILGNPKPQYEDLLGRPYVGMRLFFYVAGTSTKQDTYTDSDGLTANTNPVAIGADGFPEGNVMIYGPNSTGYKVVAAPVGTDDPPTSPLWSVDLVYPGATLSGEWTNPITATYISATTFSVVGDQTSEYLAGRRIKITGGGDRFATVSTAVFATVTTVTVKNIVDGTSPPVAAGLIAGMDTAYTHIISPSQLANTGATGYNAYDYYANQPLDSNTFFGAVGDGVIINSIALQNAINAASSHSYTDASGDFRTITSKKTIRIPAGVYLIDATIDTPDVAFNGYLTIEGDNTIIVQTAALPIFNLKFPSRISFRNLQMHNGTNAISVTADNLDNTTVEVDSCTFQGQTDYPIISVGINMPKTFIIKRNNFIDCAGGIKTATNQTVVEDNWFEFTHTNPILYNTAQAVFNKNRIIAGDFLPTKSKPTYWLVNDSGQLWARDNIFSGESNNASILLHITNDATITQFTGNAGATDADYNIVIDTFPVNVKIEGNWFNENNNFVINDDYIGLSPGAATNLLTSARNTFKDNQISGLSTGAGAHIFVNGGSYFECDQGGFGRSNTTYEKNFIDVQSDFANLFPQPSETWGVETSGSGTSITNNYDIAPDGVMSAMRIIGNPSGSRAFNFDTTDLGASGEYTYSMWVRNISGSNNVSIINVTDNKIIAAQSFNQVPVDDWVRISLPFYFDSADTYSVTWNMGTSSDMLCWGRMINRGKTAAPYLYKALNAKSSAFPVVGIERPVLYSAAMPTVGDYKVGQVVLNTAGFISSNRIILGWYRLTTGSAHVGGTDWAIMHVSHT
jgi:hypothetical protein